MNSEKRKFETNKIKAYLPYIIFFIAFSIELAIVLIDKSAFIPPFEGRMFQITFALFCIKILFTKYTRKEWIILLLFGILGFVSYLVTGRNEIIRVVAFIGACKNIPLKKTMTYNFYVTLVGIVTLVILSLFGVLGTIAMVADYGRGEIETRYTLGIGHPNALHCMAWAIMVLGIYLYHEKIKWKQYLILLLLNLCLYQLTLSKAGVLIGCFTILFSFSIQYFMKYISISVTRLFSYLLIVGAVTFSIISSISNTDPVFLRTIDKMLTNRLLLARAYGGTDYWSLFSISTNTEYFDMGFVRLFYWYGIIPAIIVIIVLLLIVRYTIKKQDYWALMLILSFIVYTVVEAHAVSVYIARNYVLILLGGIWTELLADITQNSDMITERYFWEILKR